MNFMSGVCAGTCRRRCVTGACWGTWLENGSMKPSSSATRTAFTAPTSSGRPWNRRRGRWPRVSPSSWERSAETAAEWAERKRFQSWLPFLKAVPEIKVAVKGIPGLTVDSYVAAELTQVFSEKLPVVSRENEDVFVPPAVCSILQVVHGQHNSEKWVHTSHPPVWSNYMLLFWRVLTHLMLYHCRCRLFHLMTQHINIIDNVLTL